MDSEQIKYIAEDLEYLRGGWSPDIPDPDIRRGSAVLRRLLVEFSYSKAWRAARFDKQPKVIAVDLKNVFGESNMGSVMFSLAWGAHFRGILMASPCKNRGSTPIGTPTPAIRIAGYPGEKEFYITEYLESLSGIADGINVNRREIIKYVANVKGGVHLSSKRRSAEKVLIKKMEKFENKITVHFTDGILVEIVSIAQAIGTSDDAQKLIDYAKKI
jgi:hypothetical protein